MRTNLWTRSLAAAGAALAVMAGASASSAELQHGEKAITCMNKSSGTTWQIKVDYDHDTVDTNPATITDSKITWRDTNDGWRYALDLRTGDLTVVFASSMGGNMYFHRCLLDH
jgi:outer membrane protein assembly factor BamB